MTATTGDCERSRAASVGTTTDTGIDSPMRKATSSPAWAAVKPPSSRWNCANQPSAM
jgi:hypothetical protein